MAIAAIVYSFKDNSEHKFSGTFVRGFENGCLYKT